MNRIFCGISKKIQETQKYYQRFGLKATIIRVFKKVSQYDSFMYMRWYKKHRPTEETLNIQSEHCFDYQPKISIVIPLYKTPEKYLRQLIDSVKKQTYFNWELCLSDGSGDPSPLSGILQEYEKEDNRIKVVYNKQSLHISKNTNAALNIVSGDYVAFADHDDLLAPNALYECVQVLNEDSAIDVIYTDEDKIDMHGKIHFLPHFKSDFNIDMLRSGNYICHFFVVRKSIFQEVGYLNCEYDGVQDFDFTLRCIENTSKIKHIPKILYHWRAHRDSTAENPESKNYAYEAGVRVVQEHYKRMGIKAAVEQSQHKGIYRTRYILENEPMISIVIANKDHADDLEKSIMSIEINSSYRNYEFIIVENNSTEERTFDYYKELEEKSDRVKVVCWNGEGFNYAEINNFGARQAKGDYILFLNNDTELVDKDSLKEMLGYCMREDVGAVGARLYYADGSIQHAGIVIGLGGLAGHTFVGSLHEDPGYCGRIHMVQNYNAVTAACMMVRKSVFEQVKGFDERFAVALNDVDLCLRMRKAGYMVVYTPYAEFNHYESKSRGYEDTKEKKLRFQAEGELFRKTWNSMIERGDEYFNPNLSLDNPYFRFKI